MLSSIILFLTLQSNPYPVVQVISAYKDIATCEHVIELVKADDKANPEEPLLGGRLSCVSVQYTPKKTVDEPEPEVVQCKPKQIMGKLVGCKEQV